MAAAPRSPLRLGAAAAPRWPARRAARGSCGGDHAAAEPLRSTRQRRRVGAYGGAPRSR